MLNLRDRLYVCVGVMLLALVPMVGNSADGAPTKEEVVAQVKKAVAFYKANGREKTLAEMNNKDGLFAKGEDYIDVHDIHGICRAHPVSPGVVGLDRMDAADPAGKKWIREIVEEIRAGKTSGWSTYQRKNPVSGKIEHKLAYWELSDDLFFKAGTYE